DGIRDGHVTGVQTCALPISRIELRTDYEGFARESGEEPMSPRDFTARVRALDGVGEIKVKDRAGVPRTGWRGIGRVVSSHRVDRSEERRVGNECRRRR